MGAGSVVVGMQYSRVASQNGGSRKFTTGASMCTGTPPMITYPDDFIVSPSLSQIPQLGGPDSDRRAVLERERGDAIAVDERAVGRLAIEQRAVALRVHADLCVLARRVAVLDQEVTARLLADQKAVVDQDALAGPGTGHHHARGDRAADRLQAGLQ